MLSGRFARIHFRNKLEHTLGFRLVAPPHIWWIRPFGPIGPVKPTAPPPFGGFRSSLAEDEPMPEADLEVQNEKDFAEEKDNIDLNFAEQDKDEPKEQKTEFSEQQDDVDSNFVEQENNDFTEQEEDEEDEDIEDFAEQLAEDFAERKD